MGVRRDGEKEDREGNRWKQLTITWPAPTGTTFVCVDSPAQRLREQVKVKSDGTWSPKPAGDSQWLRPFLDAVLEKPGQTEDSLKDSDSQRTGRIIRSEHRELKEKISLSRSVCGGGGRSQGGESAGSWNHRVPLLKVEQLAEEIQRKLAFLSCPVTPFVHQEHCHLHRQQGTLLEL